MWSKTKHNIKGLIRRRSLGKFDFTAISDKSSSTLERSYVLHLIWIGGTIRFYLSLMETRKSFGVDENSSKFAMSSCFTWIGSQSSITNLHWEIKRENTQEKIWVKTSLIIYYINHTIAIDTILAIYWHFKLIFCIYCLSVADMSFIFKTLYLSIQAYFIISHFADI